MPLKADDPSRICTNSQLLLVELRTRTLTRSEYLPFLDEKENINLRSLKWKCERLFYSFASNRCIWRGTSKRDMHLIGFMLKYHNHSVIFKFNPPQIAIRTVVAFFPRQTSYLRIVDQVAVKKSVSIFNDDDHYVHCPVDGHYTGYCCAVHGMTQNGRGVFRTGPRLLARGNNRRH